MNKKIIQLIILSICILSNYKCQSQIKKSKNSKKEINNEIKYQAKRDSILLQADYGSVYLTYDTTAISYDYLNPKEIDSNIFKTDLLNISKYIKESNNIKLKHFKNDLVNTNWSSLYWFNNNFCLYGPSDWMENTPILITDSIIYYLNSDPMLDIVIDFSKTENNHYEFSVKNYNGKTENIIIEIIDTKKGIAIWEYRDENNLTINKALKVKSEFVKLFPIIICDCGDSKCVFEKTNYFEKPDFEKLKNKL